jgi:hypothetical protein
LKEIENLEIDTPRNLIYEKLIQSENKHTQRLLKHFDRNVPHWFLSPWFPNCNQNEIYRRSNDISQLALYSLSNDFVTINQSWVRYLQENAGIIRSFCLWNLSLFLQARNPNIPDIPNKLIKPAYRNSLTKQRGYWNIIFNELNTIKCIYTDDLLMKNDYALEHFIPYNFISHDLIWNLIPSNSCFNIKKSDKLPRLDIHFQPFYDIQKKGVEIMTEKHPRHPLLEDYLTIFPNLHDSFTPERYYKHLQPLITIASNNGFELLNV